MMNEFVIDERLKTMLNGMIILQILRKKPIIKRTNKKKIEKITIGNFSLKQIENPNENPSVLFLKKNPNNAHLHIFYPDGKNPFGVDTTLENVQGRPKEHIHVDSTKLIEKLDSLIQNYVFQSPEHVKITHDVEYQEKEVILFYPTSKYILKKNERWLKIEVNYNPKILLMSEIDLHEERTGMLYDRDIPINFIVVRNGEILKYDLERLDEISLQMEPIFATDRVSGMRKI